MHSKWDSNPQPRDGHHVDGVEVSRATIAPLEQNFFVKMAYFDICDSLDDRARLKPRLKRGVPGRSGRTREWKTNRDATA